MISYVFSISGPSIYLFNAHEDVDWSTLGSVDETEADKMESDANPNDEAHRQDKDKTDPCGQVQLVKGVVGNPFFLLDYQIGVTRTAVHILFN